MFWGINYQDWNERDPELAVAKGILGLLQAVPKSQVVFRLPDSQFINHKNTNFTSMVLGGYLFVNYGGFNTVQALQRHQRCNVKCKIYGR